MDRVESKGPILTFRLLQPIVKISLSEARPFETVDTIYPYTFKHEFCHFPFQVNNITYTSCSYDRDHAN